MQGDRRVPFAAPYDAPLEADFDIARGLEADFFGVNPRSVRISMAL